MEDKEELEEGLRINESLRSRLEEQELGTHLCCIYRDKEEQLSALSSFMSLGIEKNEKCLYVVDDRTKTEVIEAFEELGFEVEKFVESGQFEFMTKSESYLKDGYFDPDEMIELIDEAQKQALDEGYDGLRLTGEMTWVFSDVRGVERLMEYETKLNEFLPDQKVIGMCQYNEEKFTAETLVDVLNTHPQALIYDELHENLYYMLPEVFKAQREGKVTQKHYESMKENITQRTRLRKKEKKAKKRLEKEKERAQRYLDIADIIIMVINNDREVEEINQRGCEILGYDKEEIIGKNWFENFVPERVRKDLLEEIHKPLKNGRVEEEKKYENPILTKDGEERIISWKNTLLRNDNGEIIGTLSSGMDITERKKSEEKLRKSEERKGFLNTLLRQDLRSKYQTIQGFHQLIEGENLSKEDREYLRKAIETGREVNEILDLAKELEEIEESGWTTEKDIIKVLKHVTEDISSLVERGGVQIEKNYPEKIPKIKGDYSLKTLFSQILRTRIKSSNCDNIRIDVEEKEEEILLRIEDDGKPLPAEIKKMFTGEAYTGETTGVGGVRYYMLKEIAEHNDAIIEVQDLEKGGTRFDVYLQKV